MRRLVLPVLAVLLLTATAAAAAPVIKTVAYVYAPNFATLDYLRTFRVGFEETDRPGYARIVTSRDILNDIRNAGFEVEVVIDDLDAYVNARRPGSRAAAHEPLPEAGPALDHYFTHAEVLAFVADLETTYPAIVSTTIVGTSVSDRDLVLVKISDNVDTNEAEPAIFFEGTIHGDEIAAYMLNLYLLQYLATNYGSDPDVTALVNSREIFVLPLSNPDGNYDDPVYGRSRYNDNGVDLNRNNGYMWDPDEWDSGPSLHSEPETQAISSAWIGSQPFVIGMSGHGGSVAVSLPWSYHYDAPLDWDEADYLGEQYCAVCTDPALTDWFQGSWGMYQMYGSTKDEFYGSHGAMAWTVELTLVKECAWSVTQGLFGYHRPALEWLIDETGEGVHGLVTSAADGGPLPALVQVAGKWYTFTDDEVGDYHKYLRPGTYDITISANGHLPYTGEFTVAAGAPVQLDVELAVDPEPKAYAWRWIYSECPSAIDTSNLTIHALGRPDGEDYPLGFAGWAILDLGPDGIADAVGDDLAVFESYTDGDEDFTLYGKADWDDGWMLIGEGLGTTSFDLDGAGLAVVRYLRIVDGQTLAGFAEAGPHDGFDLDAIGTPALLAAFAGTPTSGELPLVVQFTDASTGSPTAWDWDFGDGDTSTEQNPSHTYDVEGLYTVSLTVTGPGGEDTLVKTDYINAYEAAPAAAFSGDPTTGPVPLNVQFADESTGSITDYEWEFGDGDTSIEANPSHTYDAAGHYSVRLTVTGPGGSDEEFRFWYINVTAADDDDDDDDDDDNNDDNDDNNDNDTSPTDDDDDDDDDNDDNDNDDDDTAPPDATGDDDDDDSGCGC
jgi:PKD repeat protein